MIIILMTMGTVTFVNGLYFGNMALRSSNLDPAKANTIGCKVDLVDDAPQQALPISCCQDRMRGPAV